jgi:hypothetical protein
VANFSHERLRLGVFLFGDMTGLGAVEVRERVLESLDDRLAQEPRLARSGSTRLAAEVVPLSLSFSRPIRSTSVMT